MNFDKCKKLLESAVQKKPDLKNDIPELIKTAWGDNRSECSQNFLNELDSKKEYFDNLGNSESNKEIHGAADIHGGTSENGENNDGKTQEGETKTEKEVYGPEAPNDGGNKNTNSEETEGVIDGIITYFSNFTFSDILDILLYLVGIFVAIILLVLFYKLFKYLFEFLYDVFNAHRIVYLRVLLPRNDTKEERDKEREIAKDMNEKIGKMAQLYRNIYKFGELSVWDMIMSFFFSKPKVSMALHYENGMIQFIFGIYPEYRKILEGAISAQYPDASVETIERPNFLKKKYTDIVPIHPVKDQVYPIRLFSQLEDDPLNNIVDAIGKVPNEDTLTMFMVMKPMPAKFNDKAQRFTNALYKKIDPKSITTPWWQKILMPWKLLEFLIHGPSQQLIQQQVEKYGNPYGGDNSGDPLIRMVKAEEDAINTMAEEAGKPSFHTGLLLMSSSDKGERRLAENIQNMISALTVYHDEYNSGLDQPEILADIFGWLLKPIWKFSIYFELPSFFYTKNVFSVNELASLNHFPDGLYNPSPVVKWLDYKALSPPENLPKLKDENSFVITGKIAEEYKGGDIGKIFSNMQHWAIGEKQETEEKYYPVENYSQKQLKDKEVIEGEDGNSYVKEYKTKKKTGLKVFKDGTLLGINVYRNKFTPVYMRKKDRTRHHYIIGKSGGGKSAFISSMVRQDIWNGEGVGVIDPHGDLVEDILRYVPKERAKDVIYFDAGDEERPMGMNLYEIDNKDQADRVVNDATEIFLKMFGNEIFGPRLQEYFKYGSLTLLEDMEDGATIIDVPRLFTDKEFREYKISKVTNPVVRNFWEKTYNSMGEREKQEIIPYFSAKFVSFITNRQIRNIIGQTKSGFRLREAMDNRKILLINLSKGKIGELNAQLLGMILVSQINTAAMSRANMHEDERKDFFLYVDEFQNFVTSTFADILSEARKYRLSLIMAHQYIAQLEGGEDEGKSSVKDAVFGNVGTMQSFKVGAPDAEFLEKEYSPLLSQQDIVGISNFKVYIKLNIANSSTRVFSMNTIRTTDYESPKVAEVLREYCRKKYGRKREFVDAEISARLGMLGEEEEPVAEEASQNS